MAYPHPLIAKFERELTLSVAENQAVSAIAIRPLKFVRNYDLVRKGNRSLHCVMILAGLAGTSKTDGSGKRQTIAFHMSGDMPDLQSLHLDVNDSDVRAISDCTATFIEHSTLRSLCEQYPRIGATLWRDTLVHSSIFREWVVNVGSRPALKRVAHLLCETMKRAQWLGLSDEMTCDFPVTQTDLSDATGLSIVHVNRMLQDLRKRELISFVHGKLTIHNWSDLCSLAGFEDTYLHQPRQSDV